MVGTSWTNENFLVWAVGGGQGDKERSVMLLLYCFLGGKGESKWPSYSSIPYQRASLPTGPIPQGLRGRVGIMVPWGFQKLCNLQVFWPWLFSAPGESPGEADRGSQWCEQAPSTAQMGVVLGDKAEAWCCRWWMDDLFNFHPHLLVWKVGMMPSNYSGFPTWMTRNFPIGNVDCSDCWWTWLPRYGSSPEHRPSTELSPGPSRPFSWNPDKTFCRLGQFGSSSGTVNIQSEGQLSICSFVPCGEAQGIKYERNGRDELISQRLALLFGYLFPFGCQLPSNSVSWKRRFSVLIWKTFKK